MNRMQKTEAQRGKQDEEGKFFPLIVESSCSKCISIPPQGPMLVCTLMGLTAGLHQQK